jgi:aubergine
MRIVDKITKNRSDPCSTVKSSSQSEFLPILNISFRYNDRSYRIDDVCFDKNPDSTFSIERDGETFHLTFAEYLRLKYKVEITHQTQPLLVHFDLPREQIVYLIPEMCMPVGMTEEMKSDKAIFREVGQA